MTLWQFCSEKTKQSPVKKLTVSLGDNRWCSNVSASAVKQVRDNIQNILNYNQHTIVLSCFLLDY